MAIFEWRKENAMNETNAMNQQNPFTIGNALGSQQAQAVAQRQMTAMELQAKSEALMREAMAIRRQQEEMELAACILPKAKKLPNRVQINAPEKPKGRNVAEELMDAMQYLLEDIIGNVRRNPALSGLNTNYAMRRAHEALDHARATYKGSTV